MCACVIADVDGKVVHVVQRPPPMSMSTSTTESGTSQSAHHHHHHHVHHLPPNVQSFVVGSFTIPPNILNNAPQVPVLSVSICCLLWVFQCLLVPVTCIMGDRLSGLWLHCTTWKSVSVKCGWGHLCDRDMTWSRWFYVVWKSRLKWGFESVKGCFVYAIPFEWMARLLAFQCNTNSDTLQHIYLAEYYTFVFIHCTN